MAEKTVIAAEIKVETGGSIKTVGDLKKEIQGVSDGATNAGTKGSSGVNKLTDSFKNLSPAAKSASEGAGMLNNALNVLKANPIIAIVAVLVAVVTALFNRFKNMEGVSDSLGKAWGKLSGIFDVFMNKILTPLIDGFVYLVELWTNGVVSILETLGLTTKDAADEFGNITERLDDLADAEKDAAIAMAESNRKLQEAKEIAADANVPLKERIAALRLAGKIEKEELDKLVKINQEKAQLELKRIALELGARDELIAKIKEGTLESLKAARAELNLLPSVNKDKIEAIDQMIIAAENAGAQSAKIGKKTETAISSLEKEEESKRVAERKTAADARKKAKEKEKDDEYQLEVEAQKRLKEVITAGEKAIQEAIKVLRVENRETQLKELDDKYKSDTAAAEKAGLADRRIRDAYNLQRDEVNKTYDDKEATAKTEAEKVEAQRILDNQQKAIAGLTNFTAQSLKIQEDAAKQKILIDAALLEQQRAMQDEVANIIGKASEIFGKQTAVGKGLAVAQALINTYSGATDALRAKSTLPSPFDVAAKVINVAAILATGFKAVKAITAVQIPGGGGASGGSMPSISAPVMPQAATTTLNQGQINQIGNTAARAFVLESDVSGNQERIRRLNRAARIN